MAEARSEIPRDWGMSVCPKRERVLVFTRCFLAQRAFLTWIIVRQGGVGGRRERLTVQKSMKIKV